MAMMRPFKLCAFGKLPLSADFLQFESFDGAAGVFRDWMESQGHGRFVGMPARRLGRSWRILFFSQKGGVVLAVVKDSADRGKREFPLACFAMSSDSGALPRLPSAQLGSGTTLWSNLEECCEKAETTSDDLKTFFSRWTLAQLPASSAPNSLEDLAVETYHQLLTQNGSETEEKQTEPELAEILWRIAGAIKRLATWPARSPSPALWIPLAQGLDSMDQARIWLAMLESSGFMDLFRAPLSMGIPAPVKGHNGFWIITRYPDPLDYRLLGMANSDHLKDNHYLLNINSSQFDGVTGIAIEDALGFSDFADFVEQSLVGAGRTLADFARFRLPLSPLR